MTYATPADVAVELGRPAPASESAEAAQWSGWIARVERSIERAFRVAGFSLAAQVALDEPSASDVRDVVVVRVAARASSPLASGVSSSTVSLDDASVTTRRDGGVDFDPLALTADDLDALLPAPSSDGAFSIGLRCEPGFS